jgi:hypothetical protein
MSKPAVPNRRAFVAALASASLAAPSLLHAAPAPPPSDDLATALRAILARRPAETRLQLERCTCADCEAARRQPYTCEECGISGRATVHPCECSAERRDALAMYRGWIDDPASLPATLTPQQVRDAIARVEASPDVDRCSAAARHCAHTTRSCPSCGAAGPGSEAFTLDVGPDDAAALLRDIRAALARYTPCPTTT